MSLLSDPYPPITSRSDPKGTSLPARLPPLEELSAERETGFESKLSISQTPIPVVDDRPALLIGLSGITSCGKTTVALLLLQIFPTGTPVFILHQGDFLTPRRLLVPSPDGKLDAHCPNAFDGAAFKRVLLYAKREGKLPPGFHSVQAEAKDQVPETSLSLQDEIYELKAQVMRSELFKTGQPIVIVEGFLLYHDPTIRSLLDIKLILRASKGKARERRFERPEYMEFAAEDFWRTRDYFDSVIWHNYCHEHGALFEEGDVEGRPMEDICNALWIVVQPGLDQSISETLKWVVKSIIETLDNQNFSQERDLMLDIEKYEICDCGDGWLGIVRKALLSLV